MNIVSRLTELDNPFTMKAFNKYIHDWRPPMLGTVVFVWRIPENKREEFFRALCRQEKFLLNPYGKCFRVRVWHSRVREYKTFWDRTFGRMHIRCELQLLERVTA